MVGLRVRSRLAWTSSQRRLAALLVLALGGFSAPARADRFHYQGLLIGQRAIGIGGAFTGLADDPSAAFYNPGGLAQIPKDGVSISLSLSAFDQRKIDDGLHTNVGTVDLTYKGRPTVPVSATMMLKLGKKDADNFRSHAVAFSTFMRDRDNFVYKASVVDQIPDDPLRRRSVEAELRAERSELWYGPSYAYRLSPRWHFGISAFLSVLRTGAETQTTLMEGDVVGPIKETGTPAANPTFREQVRSLDATARRLLFRIGTLYKPTPALSFGIMFQTPTVHLNSKGTLDDRITTINGPDNVGTFTHVKRDITTVSPDPWELRVGVGYHATQWLLLSLDASAYGGTASEQHPQKNVSVHESKDPNDVEPTLGSLFMPSWYRRPTGNVSAGAQVDAGRFLSLSAGFFTDFSSAPSIRKTASAYSEPDVDHLGATWACAFRKNRYNVSVGLLALWGQGDGYAFNADTAASEPPLSRTTVTDRTFMIFLYGYSRALEQAAGDSYEALKKRRERREAGEQGDLEVDE
jgi:long-subunit fatty acid transport protein